MVSDQTRSKRFMLLSTFTSRGALINNSSLSVLNDGPRFSLSKLNCDLGARDPVLLATYPYLNMLWVICWIDS